MKVSLDPHSRRLQFLCSLYQLSQLVDEPTRVTTLLILGSNFNSTVRVEITPFWGVKKIEYISLQNQG